MDSCADCGSTAISMDRWWSLQFQNVVHNTIMKRTNENHIAVHASKKTGEK